MLNPSSAEQAPLSTHANWRRDPLLWAAMLLVGGVLGGLSVLGYRAYNAGMLDLGAMAQAIFSALRGQPLVTTGANGNFSRLAGHVELIYFAFAPLLALWRNPQVLLLAQAALMVAGAIPAYRLAARKLGSPLAARCAALIYLLYPVAQTAVLFDFHGDTLAMPLLMFALDAADRRAWRSYTFWAILAVLCKLYMVLPVAGIGAYLLLWGGQRRVGLLTGIAAGLYGALLFFVVRELFAPPTVASAAATYTNHYFGDLGAIPATLPARALNALVVFGPALLLAWRGWRWLLVGAPLALASLLSTGPGSGYYFSSHHYAAVVPFIVIATVDGAARMRAAGEQLALQGGRPRRNWRNDLVFTTLVVALASLVLVRQPLSPLFWSNAPGGGLDPSVYGLTARDAIKDRFLAAHTPPPDAPVAASMFLAPHLADRDTLYIVRYDDDPGGERLPTLLPKLDYLLADALFDWRVVAAGQVLGGAAYEQRELGQVLRDPALHLVAAEDGLLLFQRDAAPTERLPQSAAVVATSELPAQAAYFGPIRLLGAQIVALGGRRFRADFTWTATGELPADRPLLPVSQLEGTAGARVVHLPTYALLPTSEWQPGQIIGESFELELPATLAPGSYRWQVAWYDPAHSEAYATDKRSLFAAAPAAVVATIEIPPVVASE